MNHHGTMCNIIAAVVFQFKSLRQIVIKLNGTQLPRTADAITNHKIRFWTIEGGFTFLLAIVQARLFKNTPQR